ncbi:MAG: DUF4136 domain-containing protein [Verrucomicrobia bacterium]|nr:DUF4136 domain-containing protein [Verrucomicrobiota bacterium]
MKYSPLVTLLGALAMALAGCSTVQEATTVEIHSPQLSASTVGQRASFAFVPHLNQEAAAAVSNASFWQKQIEAAIASTLEQKGYRQSAQVRKADLLVAFHVVLRQGEYVTVFDNYSGYKLPAAKAASAGIAKLAAAPNGQAEIGTLVIDIIDPGTKTIIWRGWGRADVKKSPQQKEIRRIAGGILRNFPNR